MIQSKNDLEEYLEADRIALGREGTPAFNDLIWRFQICMRKLEYIHNCHYNYLGGVVYKYYAFKYFLLSLICGFTIPINVFGKGLSIAHIGTIVINGATKVGENCRLHVCVNIGTVPGTSGMAPIIGDDVYIAPGVKIYGKIHIASGIMIGANSVVNKDFAEENICIAGVPAKKISNSGRYEIERRNQTLMNNN